MDMDFIRKLIPIMPTEHIKIIEEEVRKETQKALEEKCPEEKAAIGFSLMKKHTREPLTVLAFQNDPYLCHGAACRLLGGLLRMRTLAVGVNLDDIQDEDAQGDIYLKCEKAIYDTLENELRARGFNVNTEFLKALPPEPPIVS